MIKRLCVISRRHDYVTEWEQTEGAQMGRRPITLDRAARTNSVGSGEAEQMTAFALPLRTLIRLARHNNTAHCDE